MARYDIPQTEYIRAHTVSECKVMCVKADTMGSGKLYAERGDLVSYDIGDDRIQHGRVLGRIEAPSESVGYLSLLVLSGSLEHAMIRWVAPRCIKRIVANPTKFLTWFFQPELPTPDMCVRLSAYGTLCERYIENADHHIKAWAEGMSPAAYDAYHRIKEHAYHRIKKQEQS